MVISLEKSNKMSKTVLKVSVSDSESSSQDGSNAESNNSFEGQDEETSNNEAETNIVTNEGWADSLSKILGSSKPKHKKTLVLSRAKKYSEIVKKDSVKKEDYEVLGDVKTESEPTNEDKEVAAKKKKIEKKDKIRVKPNVLERDREKILAKIATKGVVQLFNAVRNQQKSLENQIDKTNITEIRKDKIMKSFDKRTFLDSLMGETKSVVVDQERKMRKDVKNESKPKWSALSDDFMMGAKMRDWDKEIEED